MVMIGFLSSCLCDEWRFFGRKSLTPTKSLMRIREAYGKKSTNLSLQKKCIVFWGGGPEEKTFHLFSFFIVLKQKILILIAESFFSEKNGFCCG